MKVLIGLLLSSTPFWFIAFIVTKNFGFNALCNLLLYGFILIVLPIIGIFIIDQEIKSK